jgi:hypothetical protein
VLGGDRGIYHQRSNGIQWISALRASQFQKLATVGHLQMSLLDQTDLVEIAHPDFAGERLIACFNPLLAEGRARKRPERLTEYRRAGGQDSQPPAHRRRQFFLPTQNGPTEEHRPARTSDPRSYSTLHVGLLRGVAHAPTPGAHSLRSG